MKKLKQMAGVIVSTALITAVALPPAAAAVQNVKPIRTLYNRMTKRLANPTAQ